MKEHWSKYCILSLVHFMAYPELQSGVGDFESAIDQVAEMQFFNAIEIGPVNTLKDRKLINKLSKEYEFEISYGAQPIILNLGLNLNAADKSMRKEALECLYQAADQAAEIGAKKLVVLSGKDPIEAERASAYQNLEESLFLLADYAERNGVHVLLEIFDRSVDKKALIGPASEAASFAAQFQAKYSSFGLIYDMGHMPLNNETPEFALPILAPYLKEVHLGNCVTTPGHPLFGDKHPRIGYPGGVNNFEELVHFLRWLFKINYLHEDSNPKFLPWVGFEVKPQENEASLQVLKDIKSTWEMAWNQI